MKRMIVALAVVGSLVAVPTAIAAVRLHGVYKTKIDHGRFKGTWTVDFTKRHYAVAVNGHPVAHGRFTIKGHAITFGDTGGTGACNGIGHYRFKLSAGKLSFKKISDAPECTGREHVLRHTFTKAS